MHHPSILADFLINSHLSPSVVRAGSARVFLHLSHSQKGCWSNSVFTPLWNFLNTDISLWSLLSLLTFTFRIFSLSLVFISLTQTCLSFSFFLSFFSLGFRDSHLYSLLIKRCLFLPRSYRHLVGMVPREIIAPSPWIDDFFLLLFSLL